MEEQIQGVYVISTPELSQINQYKIGRHTGLQNKLLSRYKTPLSNPIIYFYRQFDNATEFEAKIHRKLQKYRKVDGNDRQTEWFTVDLLEIVVTIMGIEKYSETEPKLYLLVIATTLDNCYGIESILTKFSNIVYLKWISKFCCHLLCTSQEVIDLKQIKFPITGTLTKEIIHQVENDQIKITSQHGVALRLLDLSSEIAMIYFDNAMTTYKYRHSQNEAELQQNLRNFLQHFAEEIRK